MELTTAIQLIEKGVPKSGVQRWADLGAGSGLFTNALSTLLPQGSSIIAIDKKPSKIVVSSGIDLQIETGDFVDIIHGLVLNTNPGRSGVVQLSGTLIANALHYVKDQQDFIKELSTKTKRIILVEYNTDHGNQWVPYPISFNKLTSIYPHAELIGQAHSAYHREGIYSALLLF